MLGLLQFSKFLVLWQVGFRILILILKIVLNQSPNEVERNTTPKNPARIQFRCCFQNIEGISHEESIIFPNGEANCLNWIFGHLIRVRNALLQMLGENPVWNNEEFSFYDRGEIPLYRKNEFANFETLKSLFC